MSRPAIEQDKGIRRELIWDKNTVMHPSFVRVLLDDKVGPGDSPEEKEVRQAAEKWGNRVHQRLLSRIHGSGEPLSY